MSMRNEGGRGGQELFRSLYNRYYSRMLRYFRRTFHLADEDAEDLIQEAFLKFYRAMDEYRGEAEWALLEKIALSVGLNRVRSLNTIKRGAVRPDSLDEPESSRNEPEAPQTHPVDRMIDAERIARLQRAIEDLPKGQRRCLQLWLDDLSHDEISNALRISTDAVKSRLRDARRLLRQRLGDEGALPEE